MGTFKEGVPTIILITASVKVSWLQAILHVYLNLDEALMKMLDEIVKKDGVGLIRHPANSMYHIFISDDFLKNKNHSMLHKRY